MSQEDFRLLTRLPVATNVATIRYVKTPMVYDLMIIYDDVITIASTLQLNVAATDH